MPPNMRRAVDNTVKMVKLHCWIKTPEYLLGLGGGGGETGQLLRHKFSKKKTAIC